ncbi:Alpha-glucuronidase [Pleurostoma richardsiae]|uniref:Alpha-glucuronidase n=1 Tax=Pleurostoma richardsiae TaxID=41990 RepID=A0AA38VQR4_9PEZI|nr:Alpha-glucuronidase [Pleurostoma richardsiae]
MFVASWPVYENYTGNLGIQALSDILYTHFGPNPASQDNNGRGQWTRADHLTISMDRTVKNGTGYLGQCPPKIAALYEDVETTPDELLLHHVNYTQRQKSGNTVIQHFYDVHYAGSAAAQTFGADMDVLRGKIDDEKYEEVLFRLTYQAGHALVWRCAISELCHCLSGVPDEAGGVGVHPWRIVAEDMRFEGHRVSLGYPVREGVGGPGHHQKLKHYSRHRHGHA